MPKPFKPRKKSSRTKNVREIPAASSKLKQLWADPVWREATLAKQRAGIKKGLETHPEKFYRRGVPDGMRRAESDKLWAIARTRAEEMHNDMVENGIVAPLTAMERVQIEGTETVIYVPNTDEQKGSLALKEAMIMVLSPLSNIATKTAAIRTVLEYTKKKPAQATDLNVSNAEAWLAQVVKDAKQEHAEGDSEPS